MYSNNKKTLSSKNILIKNKRLHELRKRFQSAIFKIK